MVEPNNLIIEAMLKYSRQETLQGDEHAILEKWHGRWGDGRPLQDLRDDPDWLWISLYRQHRPPGRKDWRKIKNKAAKTGYPMLMSASDRRLWIGMLSAVALVLIVVMTVVVRHSDSIGMDAKTAPAGHIAYTQVNDMPRPIEQAQLICNDGHKILIDSVPDNGIVVAEGNMVLRKLNRIILQYESTGDKPVDVIRHFFSAGRYEAFKLVMPDGSVFYPKKNSSLVYSPGLRGMADKVIINGEVCFSVAKNSGKPLTVIANETSVEVLGTIFAVRGYSGDSITTVSVYNGAVRVRKGSDSMKLNRADEVLVKKNGMTRQKLVDFRSLLSETDIDGLFHFDNCSLEDAVRQIADQYQATVSNMTHVKGIPVIGELPRDLPMPVLLKKIEKIEYGSAYLTWNGTSIVISADPHL